MFSRITLLIAVQYLGAYGADKAGKSAHDIGSTNASNVQILLWREPNDITSRNLFFGPGGKQHEPHGPFTFVKEDLNGTNPKFVVQDGDNVKWTVKLGIEARPEVAATRLVWAVGYFADEDYFLADMTIAGMPAQVKRGGNLIRPGGVVHNARLKRHIEGREKAGDWKWRGGPFDGTRELDGLRVLMAVINNWDLKDENNAVYKDKHQTESIDVVTDLGASFGSISESFPLGRSKGNLHSYSRSKFISKTTDETVNFADPGRPSLIYALALFSYAKRARLGWIGKDIPLADARWMGEELGRLSPLQIRDAFRAAGYSEDEVEGFATVIEKRIYALRHEI